MSNATKIMTLAAMAAVHPQELWPFPLSGTKRAAGIPLIRNGNQRQRRRDHRRTRPHGWKGGAE